MSHPSCPNFASTSLLIVPELGMGAAEVRERGRAAALEMAAPCPLDNETFSRAPLTTRASLIIADTTTIRFGIWGRATQSIDQTVPSSEATGLNAVKKGGAYRWQARLLWRLILMGNNLQDAGSDTAICILLLAKSAKITERNAARRPRRRRRGRSGGELFAGSRERQRK